MDTGDSAPLVARPSGEDGPGLDQAQEEVGSGGGKAAMGMSALRCGGACAAGDSVSGGWGHRASDGVLALCV